MLSRTKFVSKLNGTLAGCPILRKWVGYQPLIPRRSAWTHPQESAYIIICALYSMHNYTWVCIVPIMGILCTSHTQLGNTQITYCTGQGPNPSILFILIAIRVNAACIHVIFNTSPCTSFVIPIMGILCTSHIAYYTDHILYMDKVQTHHHCLKPIMEIA